MFLLIAAIFVLGYVLIALEHPLKVNKAATALLTAALLWTALMLAPAGSLSGTAPRPEHALLEHVGDIASILFFLMGAMTVVALVDVHGGFRVITDRITTTSKTSLLWIISVIAFFLSATLDNLTTAIVMCALLRKLIADRHTLWVFAGMVVIAANAGGAWSPIGDVTTIMLWVGGQVTSGNIIRTLFLPSLVCLLLPLLWLGRTLRGTVERPAAATLADDPGANVTAGERKLVFGLGLGALLFVPVFKTVTHLPPFMGIMLGLGVLWVVTELIHVRHGSEREDLMVKSALRRIDMPTVLFFLGILIAVAGLEVAGHLGLAAGALARALGNVYLINGAIGVLSAIVDNVPLVAAAMGMYPMTQFPADSAFWELLAFCAGTGGSLLIIGSAAGVAVMGLLNIDFLWYLRTMTLPALLGYLGGIGTYWLLWN